MKEKKIFFYRASQRYNNFFDYSEFNYIDAKTKSVIICPLHGKFEQSPDKHLQGINPCPFCEQELKQKRTIERMNNEEYRKRISESKIKNKDIFLTKAFEKFGDKFEYDLTNYKGLMEEKIKIKCPIHGWFEKTPHVFLISDFGCTDCGMEHKNTSKTKSYESFVEEAMKVHNGKYRYPESNRIYYENRDSIVDIECKEHGIFKKKAIKHLAGQGCFKCKVIELVEQGVLVGGYNSALFQKNKDIANKMGYLYYLRVNDGEFYKIGITLNLDKRIRALSSKLGKIEIIKIKKGRLEDMYYLEQRILNRFKYLRVYTDKSTELFNRDISKEFDFDNLF